MKKNEHPFYCEWCDSCAWIMAETRDEANVILMEEWTIQQEKLSCPLCGGG